MSTGLHWNSSSHNQRLSGISDAKTDYTKSGPSRRWGTGGLATPGPATFGGPAIGQKYKVC